MDFKRPDPDFQAGDTFIVQMRNERTEKMFLNKRGVSALLLTTAYPDNAKNPNSRTIENMVSGDARECMEVAMNSLYHLFSLLYRTQKEAERDEIINFCLAYFDRLEIAHNIAKKGKMPFQDVFSEL